MGEAGEVSDQSARAGLPSKFSIICDTARLGDECDVSPMGTAGVEGNKAPLHGHSQEAVDREAD